MSPVKAPTQLPLPDLVLALLSLAAQKGVSRVPMKCFYLVMANTRAHFPEVFTGLVFNGPPDNPYSKALDSALQRWICWGVNIVIPDGQECTEVTDKMAERHLVRLKEEYGTEVIAGLEPTVQYFIDQLKK
jgi:hypothetical protein